jgi:NADH:ubiquinone oxidoreductase subunit F (NADH-binding)
MNKQTDIIKNILRLSKFYAYESCGQCTPCWEGTPWLVNMLESFLKGDADKKHIDMLYDLTK